MAGVVQLTLHGACTGSCSLSPQTFRTLDRHGVEVSCYRERATGTVRAFLLVELHSHAAVVAQLEAMAAYTPANRTSLGPQSLRKPRPSAKPFLPRQMSAAENFVDPMPAKEGRPWVTSFCRQPAADPMPTLTLRRSGQMPCTPKIEKRRQIWRVSGSSAAGACFGERQLYGGPTYCPSELVRELRQRAHCRNSIR